MLKSETRKLGSRGHEYTVTQLGALQGKSLLILLGKLTAKPISEAVSSGQDVEPALVTGFASLIENIEEEDFDRFCEVFAKVTMVDGKLPLSATGVFDRHFAGQYTEMFEWFAFALEVNFGDFLKEMAGKLGFVRLGSAAAEPESK